ncbi:PepSY domain-containing protein [Halalkalibacillus sediminis]|nr:PepSY domain-containing protein [Halalkalibacillus sediminis]
MKRTIIAGTLASTVAVGGAFNVSALGDSATMSKHSEKGIETEVDTNVKIDTNKLIGSEELQDIVLSKIDGKIEEIELDSKSVDQVYFEVEVEKQGEEFKVYVDAYTGKVLKVESDNKEQVQKQDSSADLNMKTTEKPPVSDKSSAERDAGKNSNKNVAKVNSETSVSSKATLNDSEALVETQKESSNSYNEENVLISREQALNIAASVAPGKINEIDLDQEFGTNIYEVELENGEQEIEVEINAKTGEVVKVKYDE